MRAPKRKGKGKGKGGKQPPQVMQNKRTAQSNGTAATSHQEVWRPGLDPLGDDEELQYDPSAYDCLHPFQLDWPCLSFDVIPESWGSPRTEYPMTVFLAAGTQAGAPRQNYIALMKLTGLGQGRHKGRHGDADTDDSGEGMSEDDESDEGDEDDVAAAAGAEEQGGTGKRAPAAGRPVGEPAPKLHLRQVSHLGAINRLRCMPQHPGTLAAWGDNGQVKVYDTTVELERLAQEAEPKQAAKSRVQLNPLQSYSHSMEGFAMDWSLVKAGRLATGDCRKAIHVWDPHEGAKWQVSAAYRGHEGSVEDIQWSHTEESVFASCSSDTQLCIWDTRERSKPMIAIKAHETDANVISWNRLVSYMMVSGGDDGSIRIWDLRNIQSSSFVSSFSFHKQQVTSVEWSPYEGSMLASCGADNQLVVWDLALERDPEEEASLVAPGSAAAPQDLPPQVMFLHAGQKDLKELHWHPQIPGFIGSTAGSGFNLFKPSNL